MSTLDPQALHITYIEGTDSKDLVTPRRYTLTHSDRTGDLFLSIGHDYNRRQISGLYTRFMRDEVLAEWRTDGGCPSLHVYCHVSGGLVLGTAGWREKIFRSELRLVLEALRYGDRSLYDANPQLDQAPVWVHFEMSKLKNNKIEQWGIAADCRIRSASADGITRR